MLLAGRQNERVLAQGVQKERAEIGNLLGEQRQTMTGYVLVGNHKHLILGKAGQDTVQLQKNIVGYHAQNA